MARAKYRAPHELLKKQMTKRESNRTLASRWTELLAQTKHTQIANGFLDYYAQLEVDRERLTSSEAMLIIHLMRFKWDQHHPRPTYAVLSARLGLELSTVRKMFTKLERLGFVKRIPRREKTSDGRDGQWLGNEYDLSGLFHALEAKILEAQPRLAKPDDDKQEDE